ncbi:tail fiber domain-containing protein [Gracilimonas sp.]|uniref:tail fiber domain-containing protein n=1 Tax=Gracilimonas sp. TaxID=1974203 RepID=UPI003BAA16D8
MYKATIKILFTVFAVFFAAELMAQVPQGFNFQAVARDADGELIANSDLGVRVSVLQGTETGTAIYTETQTPETNGAGLFELVIGEGESEDSFSAIDWSSDNYYVKLEIDPAGGTEYEELGTTRLLSVPYALLAQNVVNGSGTAGDVSLPLTLTGSNGNISITLSGNEGDNNYGSLGLGNADGDTLAQVYVENRGDTASRGQFILKDTFGRYSNIIPGEFSTGNKEGGFRSHLTSRNLYFFNSEFNTPAPPAWFGTLQGKGFYQILDYSETGVYQGGILSGFWPGHPALLLENGNEQPGVWLANDDGGGKLVLHSPNGGGENIQMGGKNWEDPNLPFMVFRGTKNEEGQQPDMLWMEVQKWEDGTEVGAITLRGTDGSEFSINSHGLQENGGSGSTTQVLVENDGGDVVAAMDSRGAGSKQGMLHLYGETAPGTDNLRAGLEVSDNGNGDSWGRLFLNGPVENQHFVDISVSNDPDGTDPSGWSSTMSLWGNNSPNIQMSGKSWDNNNLPMIQLYGNKPDANGWFHNHASLQVNKDGDQEWASLSLMANESVSNIELGAKNWESVDLPYMVFKGTAQDQDLIWMEVIDDGTNQFGGVNFRSTDGTELSINAHGINGNTNVNGNLHVDGDITYTGSSSQTSDRNLKENIQPLQNGLNTIMKLNPTTYNFRGNGEYKGLKLSSGLHYGLIAQEVEKVLPSLVKNNLHTYNEIKGEGSGPDATSETEIKKTMEYKTMNYTELIPVLIKGMQEQQAEIERLKKQLKELKKGN